MEVEEVERLADAAADLHDHDLRTIDSGSMDNYGFMPPQGENAAPHECASTALPMSLAGPAFEAACSAEHQLVLRVGSDVHSNLGGLGPSTTEPKSIIFEDVFPSSGRTTDLHIRALGNYSAGRVHENGQFASQYGRINVLNGTGVDLFFEFIDHGSGDQVTTGPFFVTFFDIDEQIAGGRGQEVLLPGWTDVLNYNLVDDSDIHLRGQSLTANGFGAGGGNPSVETGLLSRLNAPNRAVSFLMREGVGFHFKLGVTPGTDSRSFLFGGTSEVSGCGDPTSVNPHEGGVPMQCCGPGGDKVAYELPASYKWDKEQPQDVAILPPGLVNLTAQLHARDDVDLYLLDAETDVYIVHWKAGLLHNTAGGQYSTDYMGMHIAWSGDDKVEEDIGEAVLIQPSTTRQLKLQVNNRGENVTRGEVAYSYDGIAPCNPEAWPSKTTITSTTTATKTAAATTTTTSTREPALAAPALEDTSRTVYNSTPTFGGSAPDRSTIKVSVLTDAGEEAFSALAPEVNGHWSLNVPADKALDCGEHVLEVTDSKSGFLASSTAYNFTVKCLEAPRIVDIDTYEGPSRSFETKDNHPTIRGTTDGSHVSLSVAKKDEGSAKVVEVEVEMSENAWAYVIPENKGLEPGEYVITAVARKHDFEPSKPASQDLLIHHKVVAATNLFVAATTAEAKEGGDDYGSCPRMGGEAMPGSEVTVDVKDHEGDDVYHTVVEAADDGKWEALVPEDKLLPPGEYRLVTRVKHDGHESAEASLDFVVEGSKPFLGIPWWLLLVGILGLLVASFYVARLIYREVFCLNGTTGYKLMTTHPQGLVFSKPRHEFVPERIVADGEQVSQGTWLTANFKTSDCFEMSFDIIPRGTVKSEWSGILRLCHQLVPGSYGLGEGGIPAFWFWPNSTRLRAAMKKPGDDFSLDMVETSKELPLHVVSRVNLRVWGHTMTLSVDSSSDRPGHWQALDKAKAIVDKKLCALDQVSVWMCDSGNRLPANATVSNVLYKMLEQCLLVTMAGVAHANGVYYQACVSSVEDDGMQIPMYRHKDRDFWIVPGPSSVGEAWQLRQGDPRADTSGSPSSASVLYHHAGHHAGQVLSRRTCPTGIEAGHWFASDPKHGKGPLVFEQSSAVDVHDAQVAGVVGIYVPVSMHWFGLGSGHKAPLLKHLSNDAWLHYGSYASPHGSAWCLRTCDPRTLGEWTPAKGTRDVVYYHDGGSAGLPMEGWVPASPSLAREAAGRAETADDAQLIVRQPREATGWRSKKDLEGVWDVHYNAGFAPKHPALLEIRADGAVLLSAHEPSAGGMALAAPNFGVDVWQGWVDEVTGLTAKDVRERFLCTGGHLHIKRQVLGGEWKEVCPPAKKVEVVTPVLRGTVRVASGKLLTQAFRSTKSFELAFDIIPHDKNHSASNTSVLRFARNATNHEQAGDCMPAFFIKPRSLQLAVYMDLTGQPSKEMTIVGGELRLHAATRISVRLQGDRFLVRVGGQQAYSQPGFMHTKLPASDDIAVWIGDRLHEPAPVSVSNIVYVGLEDVRT